MSHPGSAVDALAGVAVAEPGQVVVALRWVVDVLAAVAAGGLDDAALGDLLVAVHRQRERLEGIESRLVAEHGRRLAWQRDGARSEKEWLAQRCRMTPGQAASAAHSARRLAALPQTQAGVVDGTVGAAQARAAAAALRDLPADAAAGLDGLVVDKAADTDPAGLRHAVDDYAHRVCADSLAEREGRAYRLRRLSLSRTADGAVAIDGRLDPVGGETVLSALAALASPADAADRRLPEQRRADALVALAGRALDAGDLPEVGGQRPHVTVVVDLQTLKGTDGGPAAALDRLGAVSGHAARRLACDAAVTRVVTAAASQPLDAGRATRVVSVAQRRALAARDGGCVGCRAPVAWCEAHHVRHWADGGATDLDNLVMLCAGCHRSVHERGRQVIRGPHGRWALSPPAVGPRSPPHPGDHWGR